MPIGVNLLWLRPGVVGGSEEYLSRQLAGLLELDQPYRPTLFTLPAFAPAHQDLAAAYPVVAAPVSGANLVVRVGVEASWLGAQARRRHLQLVHHGGGSVPAARFGVPAVVTIHDLQYLRFPEHFSPLKLAWLRHAAPAAARRAAVVVVPSEFVRGTVVEAFGLAGERVVVAHHGLADPAVGGRAGLSDSTAGADDRRADLRADLRARYGLPGQVVVYPAITYRHKNHLVLLQAFARLAPDRPDLRLVLLGGSGPAEVQVREAIADLGLSESVVRPGRVPDVDRDGLYALADVLAFPSRYEGFGAPVLEAMAAGLPVVAADAAALPEVVAAGGLLVDPSDPDAWAEAIALLLDDADEADLLRAAGRARAANFTAARSAAALVDAYGLALA